MYTGTCMLKMEKSDVYLSMSLEPGAPLQTFQKISEGDAGCLARTTYKYKSPPLPNKGVHRQCHSRSQAQSSSVWDRLRQEHFRFSMGKICATDATATFSIMSSLLDLLPPPSPLCTSSLQPTGGTVMPSQVSSCWSTWPLSLEMFYLAGVPLVSPPSNPQNPPYNQVTRPNR